MKSGMPSFGPGGGPVSRLSPTAPSDSVTIVLLRRPADGGTKLSGIIRDLDNFKSFQTKTTENSFRMIVGPVGDVREFAKKLTWAEVKSVDEDGRTITIEIDRVKYP
jgi:hypothetical protein